MVKDKKLDAYIPAKTPDELLTVAPKLHQEFEIAINTIDNIDSTNIQLWHWQKIAQAVYANYKTYDGFVVTHGTDTMAYSASAVSFALQNLGKPVVFTGAQLPPDDLSTDAQLNLTNAFRVASMNIAEVLIVFGTEIIRGNRASKQSETDFNAFWSPIYPPLGKIRTKIDLYGAYTKRTDRKLILQPAFEENVFVLTITPGMNPRYFDALLDAGVKGIVLNAFGAGNVPNQYQSLIPSIQKATKRGIPVVVSSQCLGGTARMLLYEVGVTALAAGAISAGDMTLEATTTKLMWVLKQTKNMMKIKKIMQSDLVGELSIIQ